MILFRGRRLSFTIPLALALLVPSARLAQAEDPGARADALFAEGKKLNAESKPVEARKRFADAYALKPSADIACNLGSTEVLLKEYAAAAEHLDVCLRIFPATGTPEQKAAAEKRFGEAKAEVTSVRVKTNVDGAAVLVDGAKVGQTPLASPLYLVPGQHVITAQLEGHACKPKDVAGAKEQELSIELTLERTAEVGPAGHKSIVPTILLGSVAAIGVGFGIAGVVVSANDSSEANKLAASPTCRPVTAACQSRGKDLASHQGTFDTMRATGFIVGGAALAATVIYVLIPAPRKSPLGRARIEVLPVVNPGGSGLWLGGTF